MLPHAGTDSRIWRDVVALGADLKALAEVRGSGSAAEVAIAWDWNARWALELPSQPSENVRYLDVVRSWYEPLWRAGVAVDFVRPDADLSSYRLVLAPALYLVDDAGAANLTTFASAGGTLVVGFHSGAVDANCHVRLGGYPGAFREPLGVRTDELFPLLPGESLGLSDGGTASLWSERVHLEGAEAVTSYTSGPLAGVPAVTRHTHGEGTAWYLATHPDPATLAGLLDRIRREAGVEPVRETPDGVEAVLRRGEDADYLFLINHGERNAEVQVAASATELLSGRSAEGGRVTVAPGEVAVVREAR
jgi:beta-galactosidase